MKEKTELPETQKNKRKSKLPILIVLAIAAFMIIKGIMLQPEISKNIEQISDIQSQIDYEQQKAEEVDNLKEKVNSDEYIEKMAREKLGMIRKDEIVFIDVTSDEE